MAESADVFFGRFQIAGLILFTAAVSIRTAHLLVRKHINAFTLSLSKDGLPGFMEISLFVLVNMWVIVVLLHVVPLDAHPLQWLFAGHWIESLVAKVAGALLTVMGFVFSVLGLASLGDSWRLGIDKEEPGKLGPRRTLEGR